MALINRVSRLFRADFNAVLDHIEEPELLLKQAIRDMEDDLLASQHRIELCEHELQLLVDRRHEVKVSAGDFDRQLDLCFQSGKDDLARSIIRRKLESESLLRRLEATIAANERSLEAQRKQLDENRATLDGLRQKAELFLCRKPEDEIPSGLDDLARIARESRVADDEVEIAFLREQAARSGS